MTLIETCSDFIAKEIDLGLVVHIRKIDMVMKYYFHGSFENRMSKYLP